METSPSFTPKDLTVISYRCRTLEMYPALHQELETLVDERLIFLAQLRVLV